ncbi:protein yiaF [Salmonella enterica subsp. enterica serovar Typhimurium]|nr:protein yiaF [Salmonella enterica subsp. enterica serovar Typhimurium]
MKPVFDAAWNKTVTPLDETMTRYYFLRGKRLDQLVAMGEFLQNREIKSALKRMEKRFLPTWQQKNTFRINNLIFSLRRMI